MWDALSVPFIASLLIWSESTSTEQIHDEVGPNKVKYPTHDELGFLESKYKLIMSSMFKSS